MVARDIQADQTVTRVAEAIRAAGAKLLYPPPYSSDFNPIEMAQSKAEAHARRDPRPTFGRLVNASGILRHPGERFSGGRDARAIRSRLEDRGRRGLINARALAAA